MLQKGREKSAEKQLLAAQRGKYLPYTCMAVCTETAALAGEYM